METAAFLPPGGAVDDQGGHLDQVSQLEQFRGDPEVPVKLLHLATQVVKPSGGALEALGGADDTDVIPHQATDFVPVVVDHDQLVDVGDVAALPLRELESLGRPIDRQGAEDVDEGAP